MIRRLYLLIAALILAGSLRAQDVIMTTEAEEILSKVEQVSDTEIRYRRHDQPDGPLRVISTSKVFRIKYANGTIELFQRKAASAAQAAAPTKRYNIGDIYQENGLVGIVAYLDQTGCHGLIMYPKVLTGDWCDYSLRHNYVGATNRSDGMANMHLIDRFLHSQGLGWEAMPLYAECMSLGEGWYIPSIGELELIFRAINGGGTHAANMSLLQKLNDRLVSFGYDAFLHNLVSSTEWDEGAVECYIIHPIYNWLADMYEELRIERVQRRKASTNCVARAVNRF